VQILNGPKRILFGTGSFFGGEAEIRLSGPNQDGLQFKPI
jgi:hypothetical protein